MATWIALFRGINVGGKNVLPMAELTRTLTAAGLQDVSTYIQSGNVVFRHQARSTKPLAALISAALQQNHGIKAELTLLKTGELEKAVSGNPYRDAEGEPKALHLFFLSAAPTRDGIEAAERLKAPTESFAISSRVFYLHAPEGIGRSKLAAGVEKALGVSATARNWRTVSRLLEMART